MNTGEFLKEAINLSGVNRQKDYGDKVENHSNIARLWTAYLDVKIEAHDVAILMTLLKIARTKLGAVSKDTYVDMSAYGAIAGEIKFKEGEKESEGERRGRETAERIKEINKKQTEKNNE